MFIASKTLFFRLIEICDLEDLDKKEISYIAKFKTVNLSYNLTDGGEGSLGRIVSPETIRKMKLANTGRKHSKEAIYKMKLANSGENNPFYRKQHTQKTRRKMSEIHKIMEKPWLIGQRMSNEAKRKISKANKGKRPWNLGVSWDEKTKLKIATSLTGKTLPEHVKAKISESCKDINRKITVEQEVEIFNLYKNGMNRNEVMSKFGISKTTFYRVVRKHKDLQKTS